MEIVSSTWPESLTGNTVLHTINRSAIEHFDRSIVKNIMLYTRVAEDEDGAPITVGLLNKSFQKTDKELLDSIAALILAYGFDEAEQKLVDMGMSDLQHMVDFYRVEEDRRVRSMIGFGPGEKTKGLRVNCWGDLAVFKSYVYEPVEIDTSDQEGEVALPITCKDRIIWRGGRNFGGPYARYNDEAYRLSTSHEYFDGHILQYHTNEERHELLLGKGTVLVTRQDKKPLHPLHLNAMTEYFAVKFNGVVDACIAGDDPATLSRYLASLSKEDFLQSYVEFLAKLKTSHPDIDLANLPSPYDI